MGYDSRFFHILQVYIYFYINFAPIRTRLR
jgi:hypothetical protein